MNPVCGFCGHFKPDSDFNLYGSCEYKNNRYVAFYALCDLGKWIKKDN